jgi:hypothetical protein
MCGWVGGTLSPTSASPPSWLPWQPCWAPSTCTDHPPGNIGPRHPGQSHTCRWLHAPWLLTHLQAGGHGSRSPRQSMAQRWPVSCHCPLGSGASPGATSFHVFLTKSLPPPWASVEKGCKCGLGTVHWAPVGSTDPSQDGLGIPRKGSLFSVCP